MSTLSTIDENPQSDSSQAAPGPSAPLLGFRLHLVREGDDDDMDYEPASVTEADEEDEMDEDEAQDDDGETEGEYHDAESGLASIEVILSPDDESQDRDDQEADNDEAQEGTQPTERDRGTRIARTTLLDILGAGQRGFPRYLVHFLAGSQPTGDDAQDDSDDEYPTLRPRRRRRARDSLSEGYPEVPSKAGTELMNSGTFGISDTYQNSRTARNTKIGSRLLHREIGSNNLGRGTAINRLIAQSMIPPSVPDFIIHYDHKCYSGQFSADGNFFFCCAQDFEVRMYDTSNPYKWKYYKTVYYPYGQWTITDASLSPDNKFLAYSSIKSVIALATTDPNDDSEPWLLDVLQMRNPMPHLSNYFGIWSIRFSGDGREIVAGARDNSVYVYDIESRQSILRIQGHENDVNAVCYGDQSSPHILYSGSDDTTVKVWDRRSLGDGRAAGVFLGHLEGLTYVDSKGDGRYVLSNAKDQTMKLWDLRKMISTERSDQIDPNRYTTGFDYRFGEYDPADYKPHPHDCSIVTFRGHQVLETLIRCHFSPPSSTDSRYVYTGSKDGSVYIYNLDATLAGKVDVGLATRASRPGGPGRHRLMRYGRSIADSACVRDASWHPSAPVIAATSWHGTCSLHSWNDGVDTDEAEPRMGTRMDEKLRTNIGSAYG